MRNKNNQRGITLIALVITIIILIILAGISISSLTGSGLFARAQEAKQKTENAQANEDATLAEYDQWMTNYVGGSSSGGGTTYTAYNVGDQVTVGEESFYVIEASDENTETVTLLAKYNLNTSGTSQDNATITSTACAFSSTNYWESIKEITYPYDLNNTATSADTDAIAKAKAYGRVKGGTGRLLTYEEANTLIGSYSSMIYGIDIGATDGHLFYWLGSADNGRMVRCVYTTTSERQLGLL